jgi:exodeoxyribonuclease VII large subunit
MPERTYLNCTYEERAEVKALGARWDAGMRKWYVTDELDLAPFAAWLPAGADTSTLRLQAPQESESRDVDVPNKGVPLSRLLSGVASLVSKAFSEGVWTTGEVLKVSSARGGHVYLELSERSPSTGEVLAQARAVIWSRFAEALLPEFRRVTGADLEAGIKVLLRAKPVFKSQFGFSLEVDAIDPNYTLGDLEARRREIRERLKKERLFDRNRKLKAPWDYRSVLVVAPERAAGLGDFAKEAQRLQAHGACEFSYVHSRFQGEGAAAEITRAMRAGLDSWSGAEWPDAVVIIRGGGSVSDLAWLNDYALARCICECPVPVLTGIGHERDDTSLDEVAHRKFDTPSKVILSIEEVMRTRVREARAFNDRILNLTRRAAAAAAADVLHLRRDIEHTAKSVVAQARADSKSALEELRHASAATLRDARAAVRENIVAVRSDAGNSFRELARPSLRSWLTSTPGRGHPSSWRRNGVRASCRWSSSAADSPLATRAGRPNSPSERPRVLLASSYASAAAWTRFCLRSLSKPLRPHARRGAKPNWPSGRPLASPGSSDASAETWTRSYPWCLSKPQRPLALLVERPKTPSVRPQASPANLGTSAAESMRCCRTCWNKFHQSIEPTDRLPTASCARPRSAPPAA